MVKGNFKDSDCTFMTFWTGKSLDVMNLQLNIFFVIYKLHVLLDLKFKIVFSRTSIMNLLYKKIKDSFPVFWLLLFLLGNFSNPAPVPCILGIEKEYFCY